MLCMSRLLNNFFVITSIALTMNIVHPAYLYFLPFRIVKPRVQKRIAEIEAKVLTWNGVRSGNHRMGAREFLFDNKEIGHIHWNGDLDIVFGKQITERLLERKSVQKHTFVPDVAITFKIRGDGDILFAMALLRYSYLLKRKGGR
jgi:hypothetical protein